MGYKQAVESTELVYRFVYVVNEFLPELLYALSAVPPRPNTSTDCIQTDSCEVTTLVK